MTSARVAAKTKTEAHLIRRLEEAQAENARLRAALESAIETIRTWHGMGFVGRSKDDPNRHLEKKIWEIYRANAPEMKLLYDALGKGTSPTAPTASPQETKPAVPNEKEKR